MMYNTAAGHNNGMHPTCDTLPLMFLQWLGRAMPGVWLLHSTNKLCPGEVYISD